MPTSPEIDFRSSRRPGRTYRKLSFRRSLTTLVASAFLAASGPWLIPDATAAPGDASAPVITGPNVQRRADAVVALLSFTVTPDLSASTLGIRNSATANPSLNMTQFGGGFTLSPNFPLYLEGALGGSRYDPTFLVSDGQEQRALPTRWTNVAATGGIGWDFPLNASKNLVIRPIFNFSLGEVLSDATAAQFLVNRRTDSNINFIKNGSLNVYGLGGSLMLGWYPRQEPYEIDVELRFTDIYLQSFGSSGAVRGSANAQSTNLYARWRAPTGLLLLHRPLRYVLELSHSTYLGSQADILGFNQLTSLGAGLEIDTGAVTKLFSRLRIVARYAFGKDVTGASLGLALSF
ncbi:hypothetical protein [Paraburkholderia saeva]|uniref:Autotransporter domain-containing protein n=1 Tax=Paraburkholderia saeva TaxID=2777537 RepID=A0A9N8RUR3_9BURK|nr:hypothetical protein [Paraburkholderia saeva]CAG4887542.1 hypothetical protein R52603_00454 [Paraburkholderia saeva]CAG4895132.1 hypothetical protein LMG31841_02075 [Paraburkholderia saeva]